MSIATHLDGRSCSVCVAGKEGGSKTSRLVMRVKPGFEGLQVVMMRRVVVVMTWQAEART